MRDELTWSVSRLYLSFTRGVSSIHSGGEGDTWGETVKINGDKKRWGRTEGKSQDENRESSMYGTCTSLRIQISWLKRSNCSSNRRTCDTWLTLNLKIYEASRVSSIFVFYSLFQTFANSKYFDGTTINFYRSCHSL